MGFSLIGLLLFRMAFLFVLEWMILLHHRLKKLLYWVIVL